MKKQYLTFFLILFVFVTQQGFCLIRCITQEEIFLDSKLDLYINQSKPENIVVGPIYGKYFDSNDFGLSFKIVSSFTQTPFNNLSNSPYKQFYQFELGTTSLVLNFKKPDETNWTKTSISEFVDMLEWSNELTGYRFGKVRFFENYELNSKFAALFCVLLTIFISISLNRCVAREKRDYLFLPTVLYFSFFYFVFLFVLPQFAEIFQGMSLNRLPNSTICLLTSFDSYYGMFLNSIAFSLFSPTIFFQLRHLLTGKKAEFLKGTWILLFLSYMLILNLCIYLPML